MKNTSLYIFIFLVAITGCKKFVEIDPPQDRLVTEKVFSEDATAISAMGGLYTSMMSEPLPYNLALYCGLYSDELDYKVTNVAGLAVYKNALNAKDALTNVIWEKGYNIIYQANGIIEGLGKSEKVTSQVKKQLLGEALFIRAFWYFYLCNLYGDIPLVLTTDYTINGASVRIAVADVYRQIIADLIKSEELLSPKYVSGNAITETVDRVRPNLFVASALLARVYLYTGQWGLAEERVSAIVNSSSIYSLEKIDDVFKKATKEAIWQLQMPTGNSGAALRENTYEQKFILTSIPTAGNSGSDISNSLLKVFSGNDLRKLNWIKSITVGTGTYYFPFKYKSRVVSTTIEEVSIVFRLAEMFIIRAEARAQQGKISEAIEDIDRIRSRAGIDLLKDINPGISKVAMIDTISVERRRELFCEWGHRWFDIKRTKVVDVIMKQIESIKGTVWSSKWTVWPLPLNDIINNNKLTQNEGYN
ncbi:RagB/SusD family nutrient uptake outer membrane protein [Chitinophaga sp. SYP-B3965]|uniref:RagB/SusD family nutrient uptake outer membrane protein n=1 Tax=Chitinophaga sp. SYP-B3965 TaxID=2663120 RepID=UPI00129976D0|nr:RagB/SusD family nutrient uptake outer membrane protein [Chitinophaga sp. SYP-B3965]MRG44855.1 RagB/SusD family nutrient uptake outer membrane protein [Chitinophaga sp. SYP-B3965]